MHVVEHVIIDGCCETLPPRYGRQPHRFGAGVMGYDEIYEKFQLFQSKIASVPRKAKAATKPPKIYFVSVDVEKCYDNIKLDVLMKLLRDLLQDDEYVSYRVVADLILFFFFRLLFCHSLEASKVHYLFIYLHFFIEPSFLW